jgi:hypothetical protein
MERQWMGRGLVAILAIWCATATPAVAQITTGTVSGTVKDAQGGVIPGATVLLISESRGTRTAPVVTNATGDFVIPNVAADTHTVEVTMSGFRTLLRPGVQVSGGDRIAVGSLTLQVGGMQETMNVTATVPQIQSQSGERSYNVTTAEVENLPIRSRSMVDLAEMAPGTLSGGLSQNANPFPPSRLGGGGNANVTLDGAGVIDTGGANIRLAPNVDSIAEVKVAVSGYQAEYGRGSGIQIGGVTRSGTNRFHGSVYDVERNSDWNSNTWLNDQQGIPKPTSKQRDWGYTLGGPVGKAGGNNNLFFFFSQEWRPRTAGGERRQYRVPTAEERRGDFSQSRDNNGAVYNLIRDYTTNQPCTASNTAGCFADGGVVGRIPQNRLNPVGLAILNMWPTPNNNDGYAGNNSYNYLDISPERSGYLVQTALRMDYQISSALRASGKILYETKNKVINSPNIAFGEANLMTGFNDALETRPGQKQYTASLNYSINASTFYEFTWGMFENETGSPTVSPNGKKSDQGLGNFPMMFPDANIVDPQFQIHSRLVGDNPPWVERDGAGNLLVQLHPSWTFGSRVANPPPPYRGWNCCININTVHDINTSITRVQGNHTIKAGYWWQNSLKEQTTGNFRGSVNFAQSADNPLDSTYGFANAALGIFNNYQQSSRFLVSGFRANNHDFYIQDNWKMNPKFTLDYGLRLVHQQPGHDSYGLASNFSASDWNPGLAPTLYKPVCAPGAAVPCTGNNLRALDPTTGQILGVGSNTVIGSIVPNSGTLDNGLFLAGVGPIPETTLTHPFFVFGPRVGGAYDLHGDQRMVVRGGVGVYFDRPFGTAGTINQPPTALSLTLTNDLLTNVTPGVGRSSPSNVTVSPMDKPIATSVQWNAGIQRALPWSTVLDVAYVGFHNYNQSGNADTNGLPFGAAYLPENQDPTKAPSTTPGLNVYATNFIRPLQGYGSMNQDFTSGYSNFHSLQSSINRRFTNGVQVSAHYTISQKKGTEGQSVRIDGNAVTGVTLRDDNDLANYHLANDDRTHAFRTSFVWDLPNMEGSSSGTGRVVAAVANDWQLSGILTAQSGTPYDVGFSYSGGIGNAVLTGSPNYGARIILTGDAGDGCSSDQTRQFTTSVFQGPQPYSLGLESGLNYLRGCVTKKVDLAIARVFNLGGGRTAQVRVEAYNLFDTVSYTGRQTTAQYAGLSTASTITNLPYDGNGQLIGNRNLPNSAGFGVVTSAAELRTMQIQLRFSF